MIHAPFRSRQQHFASVGSTNDVVAGWLQAGVPEVCIATANEQTAGRGRDGRTWVAPAGRSLLLSLGFRPTWSSPDGAWRLAAVTSLAMAGAAETAAGLPAGGVRLKWPNDLVIETDGLGVRKLAGVLGETNGLGSADPRAVVGIGVNVNWSRDEFPADLAAGMTSLRDATGGTIDQGRLLATFLERLEAGVLDLRADRFATEEWEARQVTTGRLIDLMLPLDDPRTVRALGVDPRSGGLLVADRSAPGGSRLLVTAEVVHVRLATTSAEPMIASRV